MPPKPLTAVPPRRGLARRLDRAQLIAGAAEIVDRGGAESLTLAALAEALGVKTPSLYAHVAGLNDVKTGIAALGLSQLEHDLARASVGKSGGDAIAALGWAYRRFALRRPGVYLATVTWADNRDAEVRRAGQSLMETVIKVLPRAAKKTAAADQIHALRILRSALHGFVALEMAGTFGEPADPEESFARLVGRLVG